MTALLLDTHLIIWAILDLPRLPEAARNILEADDAEVVFSAASIWEIAIKASRGRDGFQVDPHRVRRRLLDAGCRDLPVTTEHAAAVVHLPPIHGDPFDRILLAQAEVEGMTLLTADQKLASYSGPVRFVG